MRTCAKVAAMAARFLLAVLAFGIGSLTPTLPDQLVPATEHKVRCCADMNSETPHSCPINSGANNSGSGSTCCSAQAPCFVCYSNGADDFIAGVNSVGFSSSI